MLRFGPFVIDRRTWILTRQGEAVNVSPRLVEILAHLVARDGEIVTKDELLERFWPDVHVAENTLTRAIADIRKALGESAENPVIIQTLARRGYRFAGQTTAQDIRDDPLRQWVAGRLALESLDESRLAEATRSFEAAADVLPDYAAAHAGVANAWLVRFEGTRLRNSPDKDALARALQAASRACQLDAQLGEGWAVLGHALLLAGRTDEAQAAVRRAVNCEPASWRHHYRLALTDWGEGRLRAADRARALLPSCAAAYLLSAMVFVARGAWTLAEEAAEAGARLQNSQPASATLPVAGLHWMRGMVLCGTDRFPAAAVAFDRESASRPVAGIYGREFTWHAAVALGFLHLHHNRPSDAAAAFLRAETAVPGTARAALGRRLCGAGTADEFSRALEEVSLSGKASEAAMTHTGWLAWTGDVATGMRQLEAQVLGASRGPTGWSVSADPMLLPLRPLDGFARVSASVAARAA
jgi:DNA-binding winged helix-turn-helix (wHTH) protein